MMSHGYIFKYLMVIPMLLCKNVYCGPLHTFKLGYLFFFSFAINRYVWDYPLLDIWFASLFILLTVSFARETLFYFDVVLVA